MKISRCSTLFGTMALALASGVTRAENLIDGLNNHVQLGLGMEHLGYHEPNPAGAGDLDSEIGNLVSGMIGGSYQAALLGMQRVKVEAEYRFASGDSTYNGGVQNLQTGQTSPLRATSGESYYEGIFRIGKGFALLDWRPDQLTPYVSYAYTGWDRDVGKSTPYGYTEAYRHQAWKLGLQYQLAVTPRLALQADAGYGRTLSPSMKAASLPETFDLGTTTVRSCSVGAVYALSPLAYIGIDGYWIRYGYGESPVVASGFYEPTSKTTRTGFLISVGFAYHMLPI